MNSNDILENAKKNKYCIPHFNINNLEWIKFILEECDKLNSPVILAASESTIKYMGGYKVVANLIKNLVENLNTRVPIVIHLDHGSSIESCKKAIDNGFTSVMIDASKYELEENIKITKEVVEYAKKYNVSVEAEIGNIGGTETIIEEAIKFVKETNINSLAPAVGNKHGEYKEQPKLNFEKITQISKKLDIPLVLHGGSGIDNYNIQKSIECGICKININTELQIGWATKVKKYIEETNEYDPRKIIKSGEQNLKNIIQQKLELLNCINRGGTNETN